MDKTVLSSVGGLKFDDKANLPQYGANHNAAD
jgi:hypothetical protein